MSCENANHSAKQSKMARLTLAVLALCVVGALAQSVLVLDESNFDDKLKENSKILVEFYAPWCGHCKQLAPKYDAAAAQLGTKGVLAKVDCTENQELCGKYDVRGYPTLKFFNNGVASDYQKGRTTDDIVNFVLEQGKPAVTDLTSVESAKAFAAEAVVPVVVLAFLGADDNVAARATVTSVAEQLRLDGFSFAIATDAAVAAEYGVTVSSTTQVVVLKKFDTPQVTYSGELTAEALTIFLNTEAFPLYGEIGPDNYRKYVERHLPLVYFFVDPSSESEKSATAAGKAVALQYKGRLSFVGIDGVQYARHGESLGVKKTPTVVLHDNDANKKYILEAPISEETLTTFLSAWEAQTLTPFMKSQPVPEPVKGQHVRVLVGSNFESVAFDSTKDVLVEFYAPWCGHCKELAPKYEKLAARFAEDANVVIANLDSTANDVSVPIEGFPTLIFYPAGESSQGIPYEGERSVDALYNFVQEHRASQPAAAPETAAAAVAEKEEL